MKIQFRTWDKINNRWLTPTMIDESGSCLLYTSPDGQNEGGVERLNENDIITEISTGLLDNNNKDIYVGDIVETIYSGKIGAVVYTPMIGSFGIQCGKEFLPIVSYVEGSGLVLVARYVLGNVHENLTLLK